MQRRDHGRAPGGHGTTRRDETAPRRDVAATLLALQESAGNQAVGALLARVPAEGPDATRQPEGAAKVTLGGIGTIPVEAVQLPASRGVGGAGPGRGGRQRDKAPGGELIVTSKVGPHSSALLRASTDGTRMDGRVEFNGRELRLELANAVVAAYNVSTADGGKTESWTLDVESIEFATPQPERDGT